MKQYPSIPAAIGTRFFEFDAYVFRKEDGRNIRVRWTKKKGFCQFGSRHRLFDSSDPEFGQAIPIFNDTMAESLARILIDAKVTDAIVFGELWGEKSFAGIFEPGDPLRISLFDACLNKKGFLAPAEFRKMFEDKVATAQCLGMHRWTRGLVERVYDGGFEGASFEGVVGKTKERGGELLMAKAKTKSWLDAVKSRFDEKTAIEMMSS